MNLENYYKKSKTAVIILSIALTFAMLLAVTACGKTDQKAGSASESKSDIVSEQPSMEPTETAADEDAEEYSSLTPESENTSSMLVICFSATGNTKQIAEEIVGQLDADYFEIAAKIPYTDDDLNYNDDNCRANQEQNDDAARPEIEGVIENLKDYDTVLIGHPIWWGKEPRIIDTLMETYDFSGKSIAHFCTSGGSGIDTSDKNLQAYLPDSTWLGSRRFSDKSEVAEWLSELGLK